ncbi:MAG: hypothetical protein WC770_07775 [Phycisphaerae bacterium]|jgi:hypothetical protein
MEHKKNIKLVFIITASLILGVIADIIIHEFGHGLSGAAVGGKIFSIRIWPGIQVYPKICFEKFTPSIFGLAIVHNLESNKQQGIMELMGSGTTAVSAYLIIGLTAVAKFKKFTIFFIIVSMIFAWDIILYSTLPLIGLRHGFFLGGEIAEPLLAAQKLGISKGLYFFILVGHAVVFNFIVFNRWKKYRQLNITYI